MSEILTKEKLLDHFKCFDDDNFKFYADEHKYFYEDQEYISATTLVGQFHEPFDKEGKSLKVAVREGRPQQEVLDEWQHKNDVANEIGTFTHEWIEDYFNGIWRELPTDPDYIHRINKFNNIYCKDIHKLQFVGAELRVFSKKYKIAGTIDGLFLYNNKLFIIDWKTNKKFTHDAHEDGKWQTLLPPFNNFYKNHHNEYSLQISLYSLILKECGIDVSGGYLVHIGPGEEPAEIYKCINMQEKFKAWLDENRAV